MTDQPTRIVLKRFPAGGPYGSWPADEYATQQQAQGKTARVVMDWRTDDFLVIADGPLRADPSLPGVVPPPVQALMRT
ncbi:hypothetical protein [Streptomyces sp. NPDC059788]|uniref:hypothetical protein n=1 Tax=Streptomyces sp. NPDC059788 TaxID=3346948 RepID=UPI003649D17F